MQARAAHWVESARLLDESDPLNAIRTEFVLPPGVIYLDGNSLGALPKRAAARVKECVEDEWGTSLIRSWNDHGWWDKPLLVGDRLGRLVGAAPGQMVITDNLSINIFKVVNAALALAPQRRLILADSTSFPSDLYVLQGIAANSNAHELIISETPDASLALLASRGHEVAVVLMNHADYKSARLLDMAAVTAAVHDVGALIVWDLAHTIGAVPVYLDACNADFAVGCTYKYVNGGPGAPAFVYAAKHLQTSVMQPIWGWWAHDDAFAFDEKFVAAQNMNRFATGTQPMLAMVALETSLDVWDQVDINAVDAKRSAISTLFVDAVTSLAVEAGVSDELVLGSPVDPLGRGSHIIFRNVNGFPIMRALIAAGVIGDFRAPDVLRFGFAPLYNTFSETVSAAIELVDIVATKRWDQPQFHIRGAVT
jgi:kynureninase